jgi:iron complex outermembrane receptor protein
VSVRVGSEGGPLAHALVGTGSSGAETNAAGVARLTLPRGEHLIRVTLLGYAPDSLRVALADRDTLLSVELTPIAEELSGIVVTSARGAQRIESEPLRIEVLAGDDVAEKTEMRPQDLRNFLSEMAGVRVQQLSATTGASSVRLQGLRPRYTLMLADGLPLYGGSGGGGLDLLQLPPADLRQIEVVKGPASALYGASALGGTINLISKRPGREGDFLAQGTSEQGVNSFGWSSREVSDRFGYTAVIGAHVQRLRDMDGDGWAELPDVRRVEARPRMFFDWPGGHSVFATVGATVEQREGGTANPTYRELVDTHRGDAGIVGQRLYGAHGLLQLRASGNLDDKDKTFGTDPEHVRRSTGFGELSYANATGAHDFLFGGAIQADAATVREYSALDYTFTTASAFAQDAWRFLPHTSLTASARLDDHSRYGAHFSPRLSLLEEIARGWTVRASATRGFYAPTPFVEETEEVGVRRVRGFDALGTEAATYGSIDLNGRIAVVELNATVFASRVTHGVVTVENELTGTLDVANASAAARSRGLEVFGVYNLEPLLITALYTYTDSREPPDASAGAIRAPYLPRHTGGIDITWEDMERGTWIALEGFYTGEQTLDRDPYRTSSVPYTPVGFLATQRFGRYKVFFNIENLTDVRQTKHAPLLLPSPRATGEWTTGVWGPLEGRIFSAGVRISSGDLAAP